MSIGVHNKPLGIRLTAEAKKVRVLRDQPLVVEMELLSSCLLRKRVHFGAATAPSTPVHDRLAVRFRSTMPRHCIVSNTDGPLPSGDFLIANPCPYAPNWRAIDYSGGERVEDFGYAD